MINILRHHIKSIAMISNKFDIPVFSTRRTWEAMELKVKEENKRELIKNQKSLNIHPTLCGMS